MPDGREGDVVGLETAPAGTPSGRDQRNVSVASEDRSPFLAKAPAEHPVARTSTSFLSSSCAMVRWLRSCSALLVVATGHEGDARGPVRT